jgi:hypothetical protein
MAVWNPEILAVAWMCIHTQDRLTAALGLAIHKGIEQEKYAILIKLLPVIRHDAKLLELKAKELLALKPQRRIGGRPPKWSECTENILLFSLETQRMLDKIEADALPSNKFRVIRARLESCEIACNLKQLDLLNCLPRETNTGESSVVEQVTALLDTLEMGEQTETQLGSRWQRK